jgi:toxin YoeB
MPNDFSPRCDVRRIAREELSHLRNCGARWALSRSAEREAIFHPEFRQDLRYWVETDRKVAVRVLELAEAVLREPFVGIGKPEPLKYVLAGCWSRRITQEHRLVYRVSERPIDFLQARYHY